ncbi:MAG: AraC family transcriptional regulator [Opitutaceae bacterium]|nr:AraC family transcriptional regulator [Opitutaceae bacterium]
MPYGLPVVKGKQVSVSFGRLGPSFWYEHSYDGVRLFYTFSKAVGLMEFTWNGRHRSYSVFLGPHQVGIIPPGQEMTLDWLCKAELVVLHLKPGYFGERESHPSDVIVEDFSSLARHDNYLGTLAQMFMTLCRESDRPEIDFVEGMGMALASRTLRLHRGPITSGPTSRSGLPADKLSQITEHIDAHLDETIRATDLARRVGLSADHFARRFKVTTQMSPKQFALKRRVDKVRELLGTGRYNVTEAAREVGFHDLSHLNRCFRNFFGCSPKTVLKAALAPESYR